MIFDDVAGALQAAIAMREACERAAAEREPDDRVALAIGIGFGWILDIDGLDFFGDEVNLVSKLGEDIATGGEILLTQAAHTAAGALVNARAEPAEARISGLELRYWSLPR